MNWPEAVRDYLIVARASYRALVELLGVDEAGRVSRRPARGAARTRDGLRVVWRFHGAGVYVKISGKHPVDFDFGRAVNEASTDIWKISTCLGTAAPSMAQMAELVANGSVVNGRVQFELTT